MKNWFLQKNDSEQKIIVMLAVFSLLILLYTFIYVPLKRSNSQLQSSMSDIQMEISTMRHLEKQMARLGHVVAVKKAPLDDSQLMALLEQQAKQHAIILSNIKSQSKNKIAVTLNHIDFNTAVRWLDALKSEYQIGISQLIVEAEKNGLTNITVIISQ